MKMKKEAINQAKYKADHSNMEEVKLSEIVYADHMVSITSNTKTLNENLELYSSDVTELRLRFR